MAKRRIPIQRVDGGAKKSFLKQNVLIPVKYVMTEEQARESMAVSRIDNIAPLQVRQLASEGVVEVATTTDTHLVRILAAHMVSQTSAVRPAPEPAAPKTSPPRSGPPALPLALSPLQSRGAGLSLPPPPPFVLIGHAASFTPY